MPAPHPTSLRRERGFTMVELLIVMVIVAILAAVAMILFRGSRATAIERDAKATASAYDTAMTSYLADHGNKAPHNNEFPMPNGPMNLANRLYLGSVPNSISSGRVTASYSRTCGGPPPPTSTTLAAVTICFKNPVAKARYDVRVWSRKDTQSAFALACHRGTAAQAPGGAPAC